MKKILLIHNHKDFSGAAKSIGEIIKKVKDANFEVYIISPKGSASKYFKTISNNVIEFFGVPRFNHFEIGYYKGARWILIFRELVILFYFFVKIFLLKNKINKFDAVHFNEYELIIGAPIINFFYKSKITSHLRSRIQIKKGLLRFKFLKYLTNKYIKKIIAIDSDCYETSVDTNKTSIIYNCLNLSIKTENSNKIRKNLTFGFIGNFLNRKGIYDLLLAFKKINEKNLNLDLIVAGKPVERNFLHKFFNKKKDFNKFILKNKINECKNISFVGEIENLEDFYKKIDIIIFPSYMNAVGRPVIEAALFKKTAIIGLKKHNNDTAKKDCSLIFEPGNINDLFEKILFCKNNQPKIIEMGYNSYLNISKLSDINLSVKKFINIFQEN